MKVDFPFWGILDTDDAQDSGTHWVWIKQHSSGPQRLILDKGTMFAMSYPDNPTAKVPIIYKRKKLDERPGETVVREVSGDHPTVYVGEIKPSS